MLVLVELLANRLQGLVLLGLRSAVLDVQQFERDFYEDLVLLRVRQLHAELGDSLPQALPGE